jgi:hypothetical protein
MAFAEEPAWPRERRATMETPVPPRIPAGGTVSARETLRRANPAMITIPAPPGISATTRVCAPARPSPVALGAMTPTPAPRATLALFPWAIRPLARGRPKAAMTPTPAPRISAMQRQGAVLIRPRAAMMGTHAPTILAIPPPAPACEVFGQAPAATMMPAPTAIPASPATAFQEVPSTVRTIKCAPTTPATRGQGASTFLGLACLAVGLHPNVALRASARTVGSATSRGWEAPRVDLLAPEASARSRGGFACSRPIRASMATPARPMLALLPRVWRCATKPP